MRTLRSVGTLPTFLLLAGALAVAGCSGGSSPTEPGPNVVPSGSASISGRVTSAGGSGSSLGGITVSIGAASLSIITDAQGRFDLRGVPEGNQVLTFQTAASRGDLAIPGIRAAERITVNVALAGSTVQVVEMSRSGGAAALAVVMQPDTWNTNWVGSSGTVSAKITGPGFDGIELDSIVLIGSDPMADPLSPSRVDLAGDHVRAFFEKPDAFETLDDPQPGETHTVTIQLIVDGESVDLTTDVRIVGPGTSAGAAIDLEKSTNGADADFPPGPTIPVGDPVEWEYEVTNTGDVTLTGITVTDDQGVTVTCPEEELEAGDFMTCTAEGVAEAGQYSNIGTAVGTSPDSEEVTDEDPSHYFGGEEDDTPAELEVQIQPGSWNTNWVGSSGTVSAKITGPGFDRIELDSIVLIGSDPMAAPLSPSSVDLAGNHVRARWPKSEAFQTLDDPHSGETHTVVISLTVDGETVELMDEVKIVGP